MAAARKRDRQQRANVNSLNKDVRSIKKESKSDFVAGKAALQGLQKQIERSQESSNTSIKAIEDGINAEEAASARIAMELQTALNGAGGSSIDMLIAKAVKDGKLSIRELTELTSAGIQFSAKGLSTLKSEIALNDGNIAELEGEVDALEMRCGGIDENSRLISGVSTTLVNQGLFDAGDNLDNLANGSIFFRGRRLAVDALMFPLVLMKSSTIYAKFDRDDEDFGDWFMSDVDPVKVVTGNRVVGTDTTAVANSDGSGYIFDAGTSSFQKVTPASNVWPVGTLVEVKAELASAPSFNSVLKVLGSYGITTFDTWYTSLVPLFSGKIGSFLGLGDSADFVNAPKSDDDE
jgi:hypothetical protein